MAGQREAGELTERDRFWLEHLKKLSAEKTPAKSYAQAAGLSICALYQAKKRLVKLGAWPGRRPRPPVFTPVQVIESVKLPRETDPAFRLRLGSGVALEWSAPPSLEWLCGLLERIAQPR